MKRGLIVFSFVTVLLSGLVFPLFSSGTGLAAPQRGGGGGGGASDSYTFQNQGTISANIATGGLGQVTFVDGDLGYDNSNLPYQYTVPDKPSSMCQPNPGSFSGIQLNGTPNFESGLVLGTIVNIGYMVYTGLNSTCDSIASLTGQINISNPTDSTTGFPAARTDLVWNGSWIYNIPGVSDSIDFNNEESGGGSINVDQYQPIDHAAAGTYFSKTQDAACGAYSVIILDSGSTTEGTLYTLGPQGQGKSLSGYAFGADLVGGASCGTIVGQMRVVIGGTHTNTSPAAGGATAGSASSSLTCPVFTLNPLNWIICPVVDALTGIISGADSLITGQLDISSSSIFCSSSTCSAYYQAWQSFRDIALGLLVVAGLIIVTSEALGVEILDAYTIKKTLPRLLVAAVGITISWPLMNFALSASDVLGIGVRHLIYYPFSQIKNGPDLNFQGNASTFFFGAVAVGGAIPAWIAFGGIGALISLAATGALAVLVALLTLVVRQIVIILLILVSPIAIVAYILPRTQKIYKFWWDTFSRALLMFPMIAAMIATGRVFAAVSFNTQPPSVILQLCGFIAYFAPYFMIPLTFRFSGAVMGQIGGFINSRAQGTQKALHDQRKRMTQERVKAAQTGGLYRDDHRLGRFANKVGNYTLDIGDSGSAFLGTKPGLGWAFGRKGRILENKIAEEKLQHSQKAEQMANLHYSSGRALAGLHHYALSEFKNSDGSWKGNTVAEKEASKAGHKKMEDDLLHDFGYKQAGGGYKKDKQGNYIYRAAEGEQDAKRLSEIYGEDGIGQNSQYAAAELMAKKSMLGSFKGAGNEETQRADLETVGLLAAAKAGRLENDEISGTQQKAIGVKGGFAVTRENLLRDAATQKRVEQARGHGQLFVRQNDGTMASTDVYKNPLSEEAQKSFMRISAQELASGKSEAVDALSDTMWYAASDYKMEMQDGKAQYQLDGNGQKIKRTDATELARAKAAKERIRYIASYAVGDTDVGRKVQDVATKLDMGELGFGGRMLQPDVPMPDMGADAGGPGAPGAPGAPGP